MGDAGDAAWLDSATYYEKAANFLTDLKLDAALFSDPSRSEEWLMTVENVHHALLAMEHPYVRKTPAPKLFWFSDSPLGIECSEFIQLATQAPHLMERLKSTQKLAFFSNLVSMILAACEDIADTRLEGAK